MTPQPEDLAALSGLLMTMFGPDEIQRHLRDTPRTEHVQVVMPPANLVREHFVAIALALARDGLIDEAWFAGLTRVRPRRAAEIRAVAARFTGPSDEP